MVNHYSNRLNNSPGGTHQEVVPRHNHVAALTAMDVTPVQHSANAHVAAVCTIRHRARHRQSKANAVERNSIRNISWRDCETGAGRVLSPVVRVPPSSRDGRPTRGIIDLCSAMMLLGGIGQSPSRGRNVVVRLVRRRGGLPLLRYVMIVRHRRLRIRYDGRALPEDRGMSRQVQAR